MQQVQQALDALTEGSRNGEGNLLDLSIQAIRLRATVGEVSDALEKVSAPPRRYAKGDRRLRSRQGDSAEGWENSRPKSTPLPKTRAAARA